MNMHQAAQTLANMRQLEEEQRLLQQRMAATEMKNVKIMTALQDIVTNQGKMYQDIVTNQRKMHQDLFSNQVKMHRSLSTYAKDIVSRSHRDAQALANQMQEMKTKKKTNRISDFDREQMILVIEIIFKSNFQNEATSKQTDAQLQNIYPLIQCRKRRRNKVVEDIENHLYTRHSNAKQEYVNVTTIVSRVKDAWLSIHPQKKQFLPPPPFKQFSKEEDDFILAEYKNNKGMWTAIAFRLNRKFPQLERTPTDVSARFHQLTSATGGTLVLHKDAVRGGKINQEEGLTNQKSCLFAQKLDCNFVKDVTIPDGCQVKAGTSLKKIWRLSTPSGIPEGCRLAFVCGNNLGIQEQMILPAVKGSSEFDVELTIKVPSEKGSYRGDWRLESPQGKYFGPRLITDITVDSSPHEEYREERSKKRKKQTALGPAEVPDFFVFDPTFFDIGPKCDVYINA